MPIKTAPDAQEENQVRQALKRLRAGSPKNPRLKERARRGSLHINLNTLALESGVKRHRIEKLYPDLAREANDERGEPGTSIPLKKQLDAARREKARTERRLEQSQAYSFHLMELIQKHRAEEQTLRDRISELESEIAGGGAADDNYFGIDTVIGVPPMPTKKRAVRG